jgi:hypothetical protein
MDGVSYNLPLYVYVILILLAIGARLAVHRKRTSRSRKFGPPPSDTH